ncbi:MAG: hypothetical protein ABSG79_23330, partial [Bryobacteraceae bacterium]
DIAHEDGGYRPHVRVNVLGDGLQLAGFQMTLTGRFWVTPEALQYRNSGAKVIETPCNAATIQYSGE